MLIFDIDPVSTQGFTHFGVAFGTKLGFDLCPGLADLKDRKLYVPQCFSAPDSQSELELCHYSGKGVSNNDRELLNQCVPLHFMERAIHNGDVGLRRGRTEDQLAAILGA